MANTFDLKGNFSEAQQGAIEKFYKTGSIEAFGIEEIRLLPLIIRELSIHQAGENDAVFGLLADSVKEYDKPGETPSLAYQLAKEMSTTTVFETEPNGEASELLIDFIDQSLQREAADTTNPDTFYEIAEILSMREMHAVFSESAVTPTLLAMLSNEEMKIHTEAAFYASIGTAFQAYALNFPTKEDLQRRLSEDYPRIKGIAALQSEPNRSKMLNWVKKHTSIAETSLRQGYDAFRMQAEAVLGLGESDVEALVELKKKVGLVVPGAFLAAKGDIWQSWESNSQMIEIGKELEQIVKGG
ncbi:MAG: hypothetical protein ACOYT9_01120 [Patescibacteria group bacterium]